MKKKIINYIVLGLGLIMYILLMFFYKLDKNNIKELYYVYILAIPCIMYLFNSWTIDNKQERKKILYFYLIIYIIVLIGFTFSSARTNWAISTNVLYYKYNLIPFKSIYEMLNNILGLRFGLYNIIGNFLMLTPLSVLLPLLSSKFNSKKNFFLTTFSISLIIEITQIILNIGSFDIDDIILNVSGAILIYLLIQKTKLKDKIEYIFYEFKLKSKICNIIYYISLVIFLFFICFNIYQIVESYIAQRVDISNVKCISPERTYITDSRNYHYYSECNYGNSEILIGRDDIRNLEKFITQSPFFTEEYEKKLNLTKELIITNVKINANKEIGKKLIYKGQYGNVYFYNINSMIITQDGNDYNYEEYLKNNESNVRIALGPLTTTSYIDMKGKSVISTGKYYNVLSCRKAKYNSTSHDYYLPLDYEIIDSSCDYLESLKIDNK